MIYFIFGVMILVILMVCILFSGQEYARKNIYYPHLLLISTGLAVGTVAFVLLTEILRRLKGCPHRKLIFWGISVVLLVIQIVAVYHYYFITDWDIYAIFNCSSAIAHGEDTSQFLDYFSQYPNNLMLVFIFSKIIQLADFIGFYELEYFCLLVFQCVISWLTGIVLYFLLKIICNDSLIRVMGYVLYILIVGISPWVAVPYSDSVGLLFPVLIIFLYSIRQKRLKVCRWFLIAFLSYLGYKLKPQILIVLIAIIMIQGLTVYKNGISEFSGKRSVKCVIAFLLGIVCSVFCVFIAIDSLDMEIDKEKSFGMSHFFMMGLNTEGMGVWNGEDVEFSNSIDTAENRTKENLRVSRERLEQMGWEGLFDQIVKKTLTNYNDGTFCWGGEGIFFAEIVEEKDTRLSPLLRNIYYCRDYTGKYYIYWSNFEQMIWMVTLFLMLFSAFGKTDKRIAVMMLSVIGLSIFEVLFEARARYLYHYVPIYIVLAMSGFAFVKRFVTERLRSE